MKSHTRALFLSLAFNLISFNVFAATAPVSLSNLQQTVLKVQKEVDTYAKEISRLENKLGHTHQEYLKTVQQRQSLEARLIESEAQLNQGQIDTSHKIEKLRSVLKRLALQELDQNQNAAAMAARKILAAEVQKQLKALQVVSTTATKYESSLTSLKLRISEYQETESRLAQLVQTMEENKKEKADAYIQAVSQKSEVEEKLSALKLTKRIKARVKSDIDAKFSSPVEDFTGIEYDKKGITYKFNGKRPVLAAEDGKIAYAGRLSTYGNVVLIDHGNETRSVVLGSFIPKMNKGQSVTKGDVIGYTDTSTSQGKLYFEVRKRDKAQDTIALMDNNFLQKHKVTKI